MLARPAVGTAGIFTRGRVAGSLALPRSNLTSAAIAFVAVAVVGFDNGGYLAHSWGWMVLAFSSVIAFALLLRPRISLGRLEWIALAALVALATWMFVSGAWGTAGTDGKNAFGNVVPTSPWFYVEAQCDNKRDDVKNSTFVATSASSTVITFNEGR